MPPRLSGFKIFRPGVEVCLKISLAGVMLMVVFLPLAWGYRQHAEAQVWRDIACTYRLKEALRQRLVSAADLNGRPCVRLSELGLRLERPVLSPGARASAFDYGVWPAASVSE
jgi:hypothetical protein